MGKTIFLLTFFIIQNLCAQGIYPSDWGLREYQMQDTRLGNINFFVTEKGIELKKPLLFISQGAGGLPTMIYVQCGEKSMQLGTSPPDVIKKFFEQFHVAYIGKPGTPFCDTVKVEEIKPMEILENYQPSEEYIQKCGMEWQIEASKLVMDTLCKMPSC